MTGSESTGTPSRFWQRMIGEHEDLAACFGIESVKRQQALRYFNWRWRWEWLKANQQARFLRDNVPKRTIARAVVTPARLSGDAWHGVDWPRGERWLYVTACRVLWAYARRHGDPAVLALDEPLLGDPLPVRYRRRLISQDLANSALETATMVRLLGDREPERILEVGAGYGRSAHALLHRFPRSRYTVVDIEPALSISRWYLESLFPAERLEFVPAPEAAERLPADGFDLALSISTLHEMTDAQQAEYLDLFDRVVDGAVYLKQWTQWKNDDDDIDFRFERMPIPAAWQPVLVESCPVQQDFTHGGWSLRP